MSPFNIPPYALCASIASVAGFIYGFDTGSIGPIILMDNFEVTFGTLSSTMKGLLISVILLPASIMSFGAGTLADRISRTYTISLSCAIYGVGTLICILSGVNMSQSAGLALVFVGRCVSGVGEGIFLGAVTCYGIEISPTDARGRVGCMVQLMISTGQMVGYFICYGSLHIQNSLSWRVPWLFLAFICFALAISVRVLPHSPAWLMHVGRHEEAQKTLRRLGLDDEDGFLATAKEAAQEERPGLFENIRHSFSRGLRGRTTLALFMLGAQQLSGINGLLYYAPEIFQDAGLGSSNASFLASGVTGIVNVIFTAIGQLLSDRWGRRPSLIWGGCGMTSALTIMGVLYALPSRSQSANYMLIAMIYVYFFSFAMTWAILMRIWVAEAQPQSTRASVSSLSLTVSWGVAFLVAFSTPVFLEVSASGPYFMWGASSWIASLIFIVWLPETKGIVIDLGNTGLKPQVGWFGKKARQSVVLPSAAMYRPKMGAHWGELQSPPRRRDRNFRPISVITV
ncbi:general substrate transporter [Fistulina hepatica ATCC 64428]|uniref:General substrate transporter n=1 Tax=Fistulina hepatica ATCC 64428 TaxID=1128425 RepID=A0A0D7AG63_9AGAR|nr:general substrate transporter [Fistulina hepatica ATCC 64428]